MQYIYLNVEWSYGRITRLGGVFRLMAQDGIMLLVGQSFSGEMEIRLAYSIASHKDEKVNQFLQLIRSRLEIIRDWF
jgi:hypothetical protein